MQSSFCSLFLFQKVNNKLILLLSNYTVYFQFIFHRTFDLITEKKALTEVSKSRSRREIDRERERERERRESLRDNDTAFIRLLRHTPSSKHTKQSVGREEESKGGKLRSSSWVSCVFSLARGKGFAVYRMCCLPRWTSLLLFGLRKRKENRSEAFPSDLDVTLLAQDFDNLS